MEDKDFQYLQQGISLAVFLTIMPEIQYHQKIKEPINTAKITGKSDERYKKISHIGYKNK